MQVNRVMNRRIRLAAVLIALSLLLMMALMLVYISVGFSFAAGEIMVNPSAAPNADAALKRAANLSLVLVVAVLLTIAGVVVRTGVLRTELHWRREAAARSSLAES